MPTYVIRIDPSGTVTRMDGDLHVNLLALAERELGATIDVVTVRPHDWAPFPDDDAPLVAVVDEWGRSKGLPVNVKAWALYGRSPLVGPVFLAFDSASDGRWPLPDEWITAMERPWQDWVLADAVDRMRTIAHDEGCRWPTE